MATSIRVAQIEMAFEWDAEVPFDVSSHLIYLLLIIRFDTFIMFV